eukprot:scaffold1456_cov392-Prasinococcus_capsulatus_cf.AAC.7
MELEHSEADAAASLPPPRPHASLPPSLVGSFPVLLPAFVTEAACGGRRRAIEWRDGHARTARGVAGAGLGDNALTLSAELVARS